MASKKKEVKTEATVEAQAAPANVGAINLTITDLQTVAQIVDLASQRGAFRAAEFEQVGAAYTKLTSFLKYVEAAQAQEKEAAAAAAADNKEEATAE